MVMNRCQLLNYRRSFLGALLALTSAVCLTARLAAAPQSNELLPLSQVRPGMQGYAYTIFEGDQIEKFDLEVIGVLENFLGPKQAIILVQLKGPKVEQVDVSAPGRPLTGPLPLTAVWLAGFNRFGTGETRWLRMQT